MGRQGPLPGASAAPRGGAAAGARPWTAYRRRCRTKRLSSGEDEPMKIQIDVAKSLDEALERLAREGEDLRPIAGGTDVLLKLEAGKLRAKKLLSIADLGEIAHVRTSPGPFEIGALTLVADLVEHPELARECPCATRAAREFASPQIRNRATLGGNIGNASPAADMVPALIALGAKVKLLSKREAREMPLEDLFVGPGKTRVAPDELIVSLEVPRRKSAFQAFTKFGNRGANVIAIVNMAMCLEMAAGRVREARVAFGCCAPVPFRAKKLEAFLSGKPIDEALIRGVTEVLWAELKPIDDVRGSRRYKEMLAINATKDALRALQTQSRQAA
jgi:CO/xanthine dehydrogenase FAD-binding subunit